jgi:hypothetical protein
VPVAEDLVRRYCEAAMRLLVLLGLLLVAFPAAAPAGDRSERDTTALAIGPHPPIWRFNAPAQPPPFPRSGPSQAVWDDRACLNDCRAYCAWGLNDCLYNDATQGSCIVRTDSCDLVCQRACRTDGGPFLPID